MMFKQKPKFNMFPVQLPYKNKHGTVPYDLNGKLFIFQKAACFFLSLSFCLVKHARLIFKNIITTPGNSLSTLIKQKKLGFTFYTF